MCSIRKSVKFCTGVGVLLAAMGLGGCQANVPNSPDPLNKSPLIVDEAMQRREWDPSISYYANGDTVSGGTGYMFQTHETMPGYSRRVVDPAMAVTNIVLLP